MIWLRFIPYAASGLAVVAVWVLWADRAALLADNADLRREAAVQAEVASLALKARDVADAEAKRHKMRADEYDHMREALLKGDDDADLPDWFTDYLDRLFGKNTHSNQGAGSAEGFTDTVPGR